eukprot:CAMPEP_0197054252 /NCGR_PEP_ID=MMETSP1384-20130603/37244_1 /TAXON_ID=29189 /ORGANISM="Ammonia sp." /LENGTH=54 /DNA_ID=CAMNT_0042487353 /DNA_START=41 /DNA_END=202 /DNA_ORIENTATION=+
MRQWCLVRQAVVLSFEGGFDRQWLLEVVEQPPWLKTQGQRWSKLQGQRWSMVQT